MPAEPGYEAFLHIIHVSDMHCRIAGGGTDLRTERLIQWAAEEVRPFSAEKARFIEEYWAEGRAGHDPRAHRRFCNFLRSFAADPEYQGIETWLLDTGDLSAMGDIASIYRARSWFDQYKSILHPAHTRVLYGNHDAWPGRFPALASMAQLEQHRRELRSSVFPERWPLQPLETTIPGTASKLQLFALNSVIHDRKWNTFARGRVEDDPHWESEEVRKNQLAMLRNQADAGGARNFRVLAIHHPIHYPDKPSAVMTLMNAKEVANELISFESRGIGSLPHLVLSGHTHMVFPANGELETATHPPHSPQNPLTAGQLQLIVGSLSQMTSEVQRARVPADEFIPQQCQILTFWAAPDETGNLLIERRIVGRRGGTGDYGYIDFGEEGESRPVESVMLEY